MWITTSSSVSCTGDRLNHISFEVADIDDVAMSHDYLAQFGRYEHMWGLCSHTGARLLISTDD